MIAPRQATLVEPPTAGRAVWGVPASPVAAGIA
jgi:hypothetical protein